MTLWLEVIYSLCVGYILRKKREDLKKKEGMISWIGLWFGSHAKNSEEMEQKDGEKVSMESSVSNGKVEEGTGRWCSVNRLFLCYLLHTGYVGCVIDLLLI